MSKGQTLQDPFLNSLRKDRIPVSIFLVNGIKLQGQIESFDQYVVLLRNTVSQMVYKHAISTVVPARNPRTTGLTGTTISNSGFSHPTGVTGISGGFEQGQGFGTIPRGTISSGHGISSGLGNDRGGFGQNDDDDYSYDNPPQRGFAQDSYTHEGVSNSGTSSVSANTTPNLDSQSGFDDTKGFGMTGFDKGAFDQGGFDKPGFESGFNEQGFSEHNFGNNRNFSNERGFADTPSKPDNE